MGCGQSKIENEEAVARCKDRKLFMKEAVAARNAFAAAHSAYTMSIKNTGAALSDFAHGEVQNPNYIPATATTSPLHQSLPSTSAAGEPQPPPPPPPPQSSYDTLPPPPPPPNSTFSTPSPLQRAASMPEMKLPLKQENSVPVGPTIIEEEGDEVEMENEKLVMRKKRGSYKGSGSGSGSNDPSPPPPVMTSASPHPPVVESRAAAAMQTPELVWADYIFQPSQVMGPTLAAVQEEEPKVEEIEQRKVFDESTKKVDDVEEVRKSAKAEAVPAPAPEKVPVPPPVRRVGGKGTGERRVAKNLLQIFVELDDHFLKASESAHEVSKMLEATRLHYHSNFADNRGNDLRL